MNNQSADKTKRAKIGNIGNLTMPSTGGPASSPSPTAAERAAPVNTTTTTREGMLSQIMTKLDLLSGEIKDIKTEVGSLTSELGEVKNGVQEGNNATNAMDSKIEMELKEIKSVLDRTKMELDSSERRLGMTEQLLAASSSANMTLSRRITQLENKARQNNVMIDGLVEKEGEDILRIVLDVANQICPGKITQESFTAIYRLGKRMTPNRNLERRPRVVMTCFKDVRTRNMFYFARMRLKDHEQLRGIYLNDDVTAETKRARDEFRSVANLARSEGAAVRIHDDGIVLDGTKYRLFEADSLPDKFSLAKAKTVTMAGGVFFHSENSFLSNFYHAPIWVDKQAYPTAEHRYQAHKCRIVDDMTSLRKVLAAPTPIEAKHIADQIPDNAEWRSKRLDIMKSVIDEKFAQNPELANLLLGTGKSKLFEATSNNYFGIGATLHSKDVRDMTFKGLNKLGELLQAKRSDLRLINTAQQATE